ncbi:hypothetical protein BKA69DRAFT_1037099 [Paraphysoderma sedebokerense]|nr:hypothetical protein BKA69DRAFT_1037099 [Paraphysoderma sedebokerense]
MTQFYLLICILVAINDGQAKHFLYRHWRTCFELLDEDGSKAVSRNEFETLGFLFGFSRIAVKKIYDEFDVSGNQELDYNEFRLFVFAAIDMQMEMERREKKKYERVNKITQSMFSLVEVLGKKTKGWWSNPNG